MSSELSRRKFLHLTGAFAAGFYSAGIPFSFATSSPGEVDSKENQAQHFTACVIGVGDVGSQVAGLLRQNPIFLKRWEHPGVICENGQHKHVVDSVNEPVKFFNFSERQTVPDLDQYHPLFLIGSSGDSSFRQARDYLKSFNPYFLHTFAQGDKMSDWADLSENESILPFESSEGPAKIARLIHHLYALLAMPGWIGIDYNDIKYMLGGTTLRAYEHIEHSLKNRVADIDEFIAYHADAIRKGCLIVFCYKEMDPLYDLKFDAVINPILKLGDEIDLAVADHASSIESDFELILLCRTSKQTKSWREYFLS